MGGAGGVRLLGPGGGFTGRVDDAPVVAVARPVDASDPYMLRWRKAANNPVSFAAGAPPCSFAGRVWQAPGDNATWHLVCAAGGQWARYTTQDPSLHGPWALADPHLAFVRSPTFTTFPPRLL